MVIHFKIIFLPRYRTLQLQVYDPKHYNLDGSCKYVAQYEFLYRRIYLLHLLCIKSYQSKTVYVCMINN